MMTVAKRFRAVIILAVGVLAAIGLYYRLAGEPGGQRHAGGKAAGVAVHVGRVVRTTLRRYVVAYGTVEPEPAVEDRPPASARIASPVAGVVAKAYAVEGERVERGTTLFTLDTRAADVRVDAARNALRFARLESARQKKLIDVEGTSERQAQEAQRQVAAARGGFAAARTQRALLDIQAPFTGTITRVHARPGEGVDPNTVLAELIDIDRLVAAVNVSSREVDAVRPGQSAVMTARQVEVNGRVTYVGSQVDRGSGTSLVRISISPDSKLRAGEFVKARIVTEERADRLAVPRESVVRDDEGGAVISIVEGDRAARQRVTTGLEDGDWIEVEGDRLHSGMRVVTEGAYGLPAEARIRVSEH